ncbi:MAG: cell division protein FtsZ [Candidatus Yonathbacteria bacterium]|nr:cell division protein FtsZ [Candidatus Yonathbacteria bacterium]NTW47340.1 cell division protein FtsZ [Candidatus Yonathbacteria bacterium]
MPKVTPDIETFARIKVVGVGGAGTNAVNHMMRSEVKDVEFIVMNTDAQHLHQALPKKKIHLGRNLTRGLGSGMNPDVGKRAAEESKEEIMDAVQNSDMVFIASGLGGGTGSSASEVVARAAKESGALTVAVVTKPFSFEGTQRTRIAEQALANLSLAVDTMILVPNDRILETVDKNTSAKDAFAMCDDILRQAVEGISDLITTPGIINVDFADIRAVMEDAGSALMGIGIATGDKRAEKAAQAAINSPLLELSIDGARGVLFAIAGSDDITMHEIQEAARVITESADPEAKVIFGTIKDDSLKKGELKITVIASGFPGHTQNSRRPAQTLFAEHTEEHETREPAPRESDRENKRSDVISEIHRPIGSVGNAKQESTEIEEDDDWSSVPAFLRRSKLK